jgi:hypothetical protein
MADALSRIEVISEMLKNIKIHKIQTRSMSRKTIPESEKVQKAKLMSLINSRFMKL